MRRLAREMSETIDQSCHSIYQSYKISIHTQNTKYSSFMYAIMRQFNQSDNCKNYSRSYLVEWVALSLLYNNWLITSDRFVDAPSQWETTLHCNVVSHWLGVYKWSLDNYHDRCQTWLPIGQQHKCRSNSSHLRKSQFRKAILAAKLSSAPKSPATPMFVHNDVQNNNE